MSIRVLLGAHMSIDGGVHTAHERGMSIGCTTMQLFTKNNSQWAARPISKEEIEKYEALERKSGIRPVVAHSSYLINLCAKNAVVLKKSRQAFKDELDRCESLNVPYLVFHPGLHMGRGEREGIERIAESLNLLHEETKNYHVKSVLELTAGQGTAVGFRFQHLRDIIDEIEVNERVAVCVDTCHLFAAGYDISTETGYKNTFDEFDAIIGLDRLVVLHVNDSKRELGSHVDRHEHIGKGRIGNIAFRLLMNDARFVRIPKILETPKSKDMHEDVMNLRKLRRFIRRNLRKT
ncbi:MAG: deoxyribonuclease IV [Bacteroidota bacterium]